MSKVIKRYAVILGDETYAIPVTPAIPEDSGEIDALEAEWPDMDGGDGGMDGPDELDEAGKSKRAENKEAVASAAREREIEARKQRAESESAALTERARERAGEIVAQANRSAELIVSRALENAKAELDGAIAKGYSDGFETGKGESMKIVAPALDKIGVLADELLRTQDKMLEEFKDDMLGAISEISAKILHREIDGKDEYLMTLFSDALKEIKAEHYVTVTVSESQSEFALRNIDLFREKVANIEEFKIISDQNAGRGTMIVETAKTVADASYTVQMGKIDAIIEQMKQNLSVSVQVDDEYDYSYDNNENGGEDI